MTDAHYFNVLPLHAIGNDIVFMRHQFACAENAPHSADPRKIGKRVSFSANFLHERNGSIGAILSDVLGNRLHIFEGDA